MSQLQRKPTIQWLDDVKEWPVLSLTICGGNQRTMWPGESLSVMLHPRTELSVTFKIQVSDPAMPGTYLHSPVSLSLCHSSERVRVVAPMVA